VNARKARIGLECPSCGAVELLDEVQLVQRLQSAGMLRREKEPAWELAIQLLVSRAGGLCCSKCHVAGLRVVDAEPPDSDEWDEVRACGRCGKTIPVERLEVFPDAQFCPNCQQKSEQGQAAEEVEFCSHCGAVLTLRQSRRGLARYVKHCPECGRS
jgi:hypothetical protein